ncbi:hypothetical protein NDU88_002257, partial [Pleurodeles waltl]
RGLGMARGQWHSFKAAEITFTLGEARAEGGHPWWDPAHASVPTADQASMEREQARAEVEQRVGFLASSVRSEERQDRDSPELDVEHFKAILGWGPMVTPQTAEDVL